MLFRVRVGYLWRFWTRDGDIGFSWEESRRDLRGALPSDMMLMQMLIVGQKYVEVFDMLLTLQQFHSMPSPCQRTLAIDTILDTSGTKD
jgi:hypothetical protein